MRRLSLASWLHGLAILMRVILFSFSGVPIGLYPFIIYHTVANPSAVWLMFAMLVLPMMAFACVRWFEMLIATPWWPRWWGKLWIALSICAAIVFCLFPIEKATIGMWFIACEAYLAACLIAMAYPTFEEIREHVSLRQAQS